jgi:hypothetical protein
MKLADAQTLLLEKMVEHGLVNLGWKVNWDDAKKRFGYCSVSKKVISLSRPLTEANPESEVLDTILHEIAHALAFSNPLRPRAFGGKGAEGLKKEITSSRTPSDPGPSAGREPRG